MMDWKRTELNTQQRKETRIRDSMVKDGKKGETGSSRMAGRRLSKDSDRSGQYQRRELIPQ